MGYGELYIIPDENQILGGVFQRTVQSNHLDEMQLFSEKYHLGYQFRKDQYHDAPCQLAYDGHLVIKTVNDTGNFICYIPELVTDEQIIWFYQNEKLLNQYSNFGAYCIKKTNDSYDVSIIEGYEKVIRYVKRGNILYQKYLEKNFSNYKK